MNIAIIIAAAGKSERYAPGTAKNKLEQDLGGRAVFMRSFENLAKRPEVKSIVVATNPDHFDEFAMRHGDSLAVRGAKPVRGGKVERWETVKNALAHVPADATHIAIHDAGVSRPNGDVHANWVSSAVSPAARSCTPVPNRLPDRSLKAR